MRTWHSNYPIRSIPGISKWDHDVLWERRIRTTQGLLKAAAKRQDRDALSLKTGISPELLLEYVNACHLLSLKRLSSKYVEILRSVGCRTVKDLRGRNPYNLHYSMVLKNRDLKILKVDPALPFVQGWIKSARIEPLVITYE